jgi:hypothetical protein
LSEIVFLKKLENTFEKQQVRRPVLFAQKCLLFDTIFKIHHCRGDWTTASFA